MNTPGTSKAFSEFRSCSNERPPKKWKILIDRGHLLAFVAEQLRNSQKAFEAPGRLFARGRLLI